jgi:adenylate kinase
LTSSTVSEETLAPAEEQFLPGPILLLGAPGVGKGTQAQALVAEFGIPQISTGDILRGNIAKGTALGLKAKGLMSQGLFVEDETVNHMVGIRLSEPDTRNGFILDGFPRTLVQASWLDGFLGSARPAAEGDSHAGPAKPLPVVAISINLTYDELLRRITGRRTCPVCKRSYNIYSQPPLKPGICDVEGAALQQRPDDTEAVFAERMRAFEAQTAPVIEHYRRQARFREVDGARAISEVTASVLAALKELRKTSVASS